MLLLEGDSKVPTSGNIQYIDQMSVTGGKATFTLKPRALTTGKYYIYISTSDKALEPIALFEYGPQPAYTMGDIDGDGEFTATDALYALQMAVGLGNWSTNQELAARVCGDAFVSASDALKILQRAVGLITSF